MQYFKVICYFHVCLVVSSFTRADLDVDTCSGPILSSNMGRILGTTMKTDLNREIYAFRGIPYAQPPIGNLRFKPPLPITPWKNIFDARSDSTVCLQPDTVPGFMNGKEDCLVLQIYTPKIPVLSEPCKNPLPVMVFIHGGSFLTGSSSAYYYGPDKLLDRDIVLVAFNYRLGVFGFLSTGDKEAYGNFGLLDQVMALKWIKKNIADYCGNPDRVTIFGESAGGASVIHLLLSPAAKGLFHGAIAQSGTALIHELIQRRPKAKTIALAKNLNCSTRSSAETVRCLRSKTGEELINGVVDISMWQGFPPDFLPVVEPHHKGAFQTEDFELVARKGTFNKVPVISGVNRDEAAIIYAPILAYLEGGTFNAKFVDDIFEKIVRKFSRYKSSECEAKIREEYFKGVNFSDETAVRKGFIEGLSDAVFKAPHDKTVRYISQFISTYMYTFEYRGDNWVGEVLLNLRDNTSVGHSDDILYLFSGLGRLKGHDSIVSQFFLELWTNFARTGNPTPDGVPLTWEPISEDQFKYLKISDRLEMVYNDYLPERMKFWKEIDSCADKRPDISFGEPQLQPSVSFAYRLSFSVVTAVFLMVLASSSPHLLQY